MKQKDIAAALNVTPRTVRNYEDMDGYPKDGTIEEIKAWHFLYRSGPGGKSYADMEDAELIRTRREGEAMQSVEKGRMAEIERRFREGELVRWDDVASQRQRAAITLQNQLLNLPSEVRQRMESGVEPGLIEAWMLARLRELINQACDEGMKR